MVNTILDATLAVIIGRIFTARHGLFEWAAVSVTLFVVLRIFL